MKYLYIGLTLLAGIALSSCSATRTSSGNGYYDQNNYSSGYDQPGPISYQQFYDDLSPYGSWMNYQDYGYVWRPAISDFRPYYSNGHWVYSDYGWTWVSNYNWGWAPFHYGRWTYDNMYGWMWVPGYEWAPAWVSWRGGGDYYGWAPLGPGMGINVSVGSIPYNNWAFVPCQYINSPRINNYYVNQSRNVTIINNTTIINNNNTTIVNNKNYSRPVYYSGPSVNEVEKVTHSKVRQFNIVDANKPQSPRIERNQLNIYRPVVKETSSADNTRPSRVINAAPGSATPGNNGRSFENNQPQNNGAQRNRQFNNNQSETGNRNTDRPVINRPTTPASPQQVERNDRGISPQNTPNAPVRTFPQDNRPNQQQPAAVSPAQPKPDQPVRNRNNNENPSMNRQNMTPVYTPPMNHNERMNQPQPQRQVQTPQQPQQPARQMERQQNPQPQQQRPDFRDRRTYIDNVRPGQHVVHDEQPRQP